MPRGVKHAIVALHDADAEKAERKVRAMLKRHGGDVRATAGELVMSEKTLHRLLTEWGMRRKAAERFV